jgi:hypothetical protein
MKSAPHATRDASLPPEGARRSFGAALQEQQWH